MHWQCLAVEPARRLEVGASAGKECTGYRAHCPSTAKTPPWSVVALGATAPLVLGAGRSEAEHDAGVLNRAVGIEQPDADHADIGLCQRPAHTVVPAEAQHLDVVVGEDQEVRVRLRDTCVVERRPVERLVTPEHAELSIACAEPEKVQSLSSAGPIVDHEEFQPVRMY